MRPPVNVSAISPDHENDLCLFAFREDIWLEEDSVFEKLKDFKWILVVRVWIHISPSKTVFRMLIVNG